MSHYVLQKWLWFHHKEGQWVPDHLFLDLRYHLSHSLELDYYNKSYITYHHHLGYKDMSPNFVQFLGQFLAISTQFALHQVTM